MYYLCLTLTERTSARNYSENLSIKWKGVWKTDASWHKRYFAGLFKRRRANFTTLHRFMKSMLFFLSFSSFFLFYRNSTLLTPQAQSARRDSVVRFATPVTILQRIRYDRAYPFVHATRTYVRTHVHERRSACTRWVAVLRVRHVSPTW